MAKGEPTHPFTKGDIGVVAITQVANGYNIKNNIEPKEPSYEN